MASEFFKSDSGHVLKAVVGAEGRVVAKNFDTAQLFPGDVGIHFRFDHKGKGELKPAQRAEAIRMVHAMSDDLLQQLGEETDVGYKPGTVVLLTGPAGREDICVVVKDCGDYLILDQLNYEGRIVRTRKSVHSYEFVEIPTGEWKGLAGLLVAYLSDRNREKSSSSEIPLPIDAIKELPNNSVLAHVLLVLLYNDGCSGYWAQGQSLALLPFVTDEQILMSLVSTWERNWGYSECRLEALRQINNQAFLRCALAPRRGDCRKSTWGGKPLAIVIRKIDDPQLLLAMVQEGEVVSGNTVYRKFNGEVSSALIERLVELEAWAILKQFEQMQQYEELSRYARVKLLQHGRGGKRI